MTTQFLKTKPRLGGAFYYSKNSNCLDQDYRELPLYNLHQLPIRTLNIFLNNFKGFNIIFFIISIFITSKRFSISGISLSVKLGDPASPHFPRLSNLLIAVSLLAYRYTSYTGHLISSAMVTNLSTCVASVSK